MAKGRRMAKRGGGVPTFVTKSMNWVKKHWVKVVVIILVVVLLYWILNNTMEGFSEHLTVSKEETSYANVDGSSTTDLTTTVTQTMDDGSKSINTTIKKWLSSASSVVSTNTTQTIFLPFTESSTLADKYSYMIIKTENGKTTITNTKSSSLLNSADNALIASFVSSSTKAVTKLPVVTYNSGASSANAFPPSGATNEYIMNIVISYTDGSVTTINITTKNTYASSVNTYSGSTIIRTTIPAPLKKKKKKKNFWQRLFGRK